MSVVVVAVVVDVDVDDDNVDDDNVRGEGDKNGPTVPSPHPLLKQLLRNLNNEPNISPITEQIKRQQKLKPAETRKIQEG